MKGENVGQQTVIVEYYLSWVVVVGQMWNLRFSHCDACMGGSVVSQCGLYRNLWGSFAVEYVGRLGGLLAVRYEGSFSDSIGVACVQLWGPAPQRW